MVTAPDCAKRHNLGLFLHGFNGKLRHYFAEANTFFSLAKRGSPFSFTIPVSP